MQQVQVTGTLLFVPRDFLGAAAVVTKGPAKRQVNIQRQWLGNKLIVAGSRKSPVCGGVKTLDKLNRCRV
jgi:hypothetical protein